MDDVLTVPQGEITLHRDHHDSKAPLRAWDAADLYALEHLAELGIATRRALVVNDAFGALAVALAGGTEAEVVSWSDSQVAINAATANLRRNEIDTDAVRFVPSTEDPAGPFDVVLVKVPRTLAFLTDQLRRLRPMLVADTVVIGAGMTKAVHRSTIEAFEHTVGPTPTSLARKKARLLLAAVDPDLDAPQPSPPTTWTTPEGVSVTNHPNAFSSTSLDIGTRLLLDHLPSPPARSTVVDLGCGNGVVAATLAHRRPDIEIVCCDESHQAIASARSTVGAAAPDTSARFHVTDVLDGVDDDSADFVVVNPPFHAGGARTSDVARRMFAEARRVLRPGGELRVVGNRHLDHHVQLKRLFGRVEVVASNAKFVVLRSPR